MINGKPLTGRTILVVETEMLIALEVEQTMLDAGAERVHIMRRHEAFEFVPDTGYRADLLIVDFRAAQNGLGDISTLVGADTPVVVLTTNGEAKVTNWLTDQYRVVQKPFSPAELVEAAQSLIA